MPRVKRGTTHTKRRKNILKQTKGYKWGRKKNIKQAKEAILHAGTHALGIEEKSKGYKDVFGKLNLMQH